MQRLPQRRADVVVIALALLTASAAPKAFGAGPSCFACHEKEKQQFESSAHAQAGLSCVDCHGGDPKDTEATAHSTDDFKRPANKREIAESCARCHSDVRRMNPYGLPTDQLDRYKTSKHGEALFGKGDEHVAVCTDCHGVHDILKVRSPQARTYPANIPQTCGRCHSDAALMSQYKLPADAVEQYKTSYHAHLLFEKGDISAPTCVTCHGNHGAMPPGTAQVGQVCGKCHGRQRDLFEKSPHAPAATTGKFNECISCHGNHAIQKASIDLYAITCAQCHAADTKAHALRNTLVSVLQKAKDAYEQAGERVHEATVRGLATDDEQLLLQESKTQVTQMEALQHTLSPDELQPAATRNEQIIKETLIGVDRLERVELFKRLALVPIWGFLLLMAILFAVKRLILLLRGKS